MYAFGVLLFELMTGVKPIAGDSVERIFYSILNEPLNLEPHAAGRRAQAGCRPGGPLHRQESGERPQGFAPVCADLERSSPRRMRPRWCSEAPADPYRSRPPRPAWLSAGDRAAVVALAAVGTSLRGRSRNRTPVGEESPLRRCRRCLATSAGRHGAGAGGRVPVRREERTVTLPAFYIDKTEVTNGVRGLLQGHGHAAAARFPADKPDYPVVNVSILDAQALCHVGRQASAHRARMGEGGARRRWPLMFPWGNDRDPARANVGHEACRPDADCAGGAEPFTAAANGRQRVGTGRPILILRTDTCWSIRKVLTPQTPEDERGTLRGRGLQLIRSVPNEVSGTSTPLPARWKHPNIGFRCVKDAQ